MEKDLNVWLGHIEDSIDIIDQHLAGCSFVEFQNSITKQDAVVRRLEIIGEAVNNIPESFQKEFNSFLSGKRSAVRGFSPHS